jgi:hypothetical protein
MLYRLAKEAYAEADHRWMRGDWLNQPFFAGLGDLFADAADFLGWPQ